MSLNKRVLLQISALIATLSAFLVIGYTSIHNNNESADIDIAMASDQLINTPRPEFTLPDMNGKAYSISDWEGQVVLINFWATWCQPCLREIPVLIKMQNRYEKQGLQLAGIAIDELDTIEHFIDDTGIKFNFPVLHSHDTAIAIAIDYGNRLGILPYTVIIDRQGKINYIKFGEIEQNEIEKRIKALI